MNMEIEPQGNIHISKQTIATIAFQAVQRSYGVVGLASRNIVDGLTHALVKDPTHGIDVEYKNDLITSISTSLLNTAPELNQLLPVWLTPFVIRSRKPSVFR